jgi:hypothetical protein
MTAKDWKTIGLLAGAASALLALHGRGVDKRWHSALATIAIIASVAPRL